MDELKDWWRRIRPSVLSGMIAGFAKLVGQTLRIETQEPTPLASIPGGKIVCGWHGKSFVASAKWRNLGHWVMISHSKDGEIQNKVFESLGFRVIRGSTGRGGVRATLEGIKALKSGDTMAITPDGPRGPSGVVQDGVLFMAQKSGAALIPVGISAKVAVRVGSWDRYMIPLPFSRAVMLFGDPIYVRGAADAEEIEVLRRSLEDEIHRLERLAEEHFRRTTRQVTA